MNIFQTRSHIPKNAGTTVVHLLRRNYGIAHLDAMPRMTAGLLQYSSKNMRSDLRRFPWICSISGHYLFPWEDYGEVSSRLLWFTFLRDPIQRFLSQYEFQVTRYGLSGDFWEWKRKYRRDNQQVVHLAGEPDLEAAKQILSNQISAFGLAERFDESLLIIRRRLGLESLNLAYLKAKNVSKGNLKQAIIDQYDRYLAPIQECNELDISLYSYAVNILWPKQVDEYGGEEALKKEQTLIIENPNFPSREVVNEKLNMIFRNIVYKPLARITS